MNEFNKNLINSVQEVRGLGVTLTQLAKLLNVSTTAMGAFARGNHQCIGEESKNKLFTILQEYQKVDLTEFRKNPKGGTKIEETN